jgi:hypothetical protein
MDWLPEVALLPLQEPDAVHEVAELDVQATVVDPPLLTDVGDAERVTVGAGVFEATLTDAARLLVPPLPLSHVSVKVADAASGPTDSLPDVDLLPLQPPEAVQVDAFVVLHVSVVVPCAFTVVGLALSVIEGSGEPPLFCSLKKKTFS